MKCSCVVIEMSSDSVCMYFAWHANNHDVVPHKFMKFVSQRNYLAILTVARLTSISMRRDTYIWVTGYREPILTDYAMPQKLYSLRGCTFQSRVLNSTSLWTN